MNCKVVLNIIVQQIFLSFFVDSDKDTLYISFNRLQIKLRIHKYNENMSQNNNK